MSNRESHATGVNTRGFDNLMSNSNGNGGNRVVPPAKNGHHDANNGLPSFESKNLAYLYDKKPPFAAGDHIYNWCQYLMVRKAYQHHAIVLSCWRELDLDGHWALDILEFTAPENSMSDQNGSKRIFNSLSSMACSPDASSCTSLRKLSRVLAKGWCKVEYNVDEKRLRSRCAGSCTLAKSDRPGLILQRAEFLIKNPNVLPPYDFITANCECIAVWCMTGTWATLQAAFLFEALSRATIATVFTMNPAAFAAVAAHGLVEWRCRQTWKKHTEMLRDKFWDATMEHPDAFAASI